MTRLITSTTESTGKTGVALAAATLAQDRGRAVGYMKPRGTRLESAVGKTFDADPALARDLLDLDAALEDLEPVVYTPTFVKAAIRGQEDPTELRSRVRTAYDSVAADTDWMVLEGGGSLASGGVVDLTDADVAELLDADAVVVARYTDERTVDDLLAVADAFGDRLDGVVFNAVPEDRRDELEADIAPFLAANDIPTLGVLPRDPDLAGVTVGELADALGAEVLTDVDTSATLERFHVGAMGAETALTHLRRTRHAALITGGDRSDIQTAALEAPGVACLVLTGGIDPAGAVVGRATEAEVPILLVNGDTLTTVERAADVLDQGRTRDRHTVDRVRDLLVEHADVDALLDID
ncbi:MAG: phosphotransacetylase family protein [Halobacteriaceae archaeon]